jgi:indolepyruvate ferredoxin oxidoreductase
VSGAAEPEESVAEDLPNAHRQRPSAPPIEYHLLMSTTAPFASIGLVAGTSDVVALDGRYTADEGCHFLTGIGAMVRLPLQQMRADRAHRRQTRAFISGYPGSPLGGLDLELFRRSALLLEHGIVHQPGINEELAATAVFGSQVATVSPGFAGDGVLGVWYGKAPGLDRAADALRHGNTAGTGSASGVVVLVGDDPACKSSSLPSASERLCADLGLPVLHPGDIQDLLDLGRHAVALSRASGLWTAMKVVTGVADATATVDLASGRVSPQLPDGAGMHRTGVNLHQPYSTELERDLVEKRLPLAEAYGALNQLNQTTVQSSDDWLGIVASGHTYVDLVDGLRILGLEVGDLADLGVRVLRIRMLHPMNHARLREFARGLSELLVVEEKRPFIETEIRTALYGTSVAPVLLGKHDEQGATLVPGWGALDPDRIADVLRSCLGRRIDAARFTPIRAAQPPREQLTLVPARTPWFCSGCPHSVSTQVPDGALVGTGIGCHALASRMDPARTGQVLSNTQMGGEGAQWVGAAPFLSRKHLFQNLGDGTLVHSGWLSVRFAVAAGSHITFKLLYNGAVSMTGGQEPVGIRSVPDMVRGLLAEGVARIIITADDVTRYRGVKLPQGVDVWDRDRMLEAQQTLAAVPGVSVLVHDQVCAAELRRARKRGKAPKPAELIAIASHVCEGCGDCGVKSTCLSLHPLETPFGTKTTVHQGSCNNDKSCLAGDCPSFMMITPAGRGTRRQSGLLEPPTRLPDPSRAPGVDAAVIRMVGIGGTGVVTTAQVIGMAAAFEGLTVKGLDQTGLSQKAGPVVSDLRISRSSAIASGRASSRGIDLLLVFDLLTATAAENLIGLKGDRTLAVGSTSRTPTGAMVGHPDLRYPAAYALSAQIESAVQAATWVDAERLTDQILGDISAANFFLVGMAYQLGGLPVLASSLEAAIRENGVAVEKNVAAFRWGRAEVVKPFTSEDMGVKPPPPFPAGLQAGLAKVHKQARPLASERALDLIGYQNMRYAARYLEVLAVASTTRSAPFTIAVADNLHRLMAYKDEYEVARLHTSPAARREAEAVGGEGARVIVLLHPPALRALGLKRKLRFGPRMRPALRALTLGKRLRGTPFDPFGATHLRRLERELRDDYVELVGRLVADFDRAGEERSTRIAELPKMVRGYESVKLANVDRYREALRQAMDTWVQPAGETHSSALGTLLPRDGP